MLGKLSALFDRAFSGERELPAAEREHGLRVATALLLIEVARADYADDLVEDAAMLASLQGFFSLSTADATLLLKRNQGLVQSTFRALFVTLRPA